MKAGWQWCSPPVRSFIALCTDSAMLSNERDYFWPCDGIFIKVSNLWTAFRAEIAHVPWLCVWICFVWVNELKKNSWITHLLAKQVSLPRIQRQVLPPKIPKCRALYTFHIQNSVRYARYFTTSVLADWSWGPFWTPDLSQCCLTPG